MIPFDEIDRRLKQLGKDRAWLSEASGRPPDSIRVALARNAPPSKRSGLLQKALTDAIEKEAANQAGPATLPEPLGHRVFIEPTPEQFDRWMNAAYSKPGRTFDEWAKAGLEAIAAQELEKLTVKQSPSKPKIKALEDPPKSRKRKAE